MTKVFNSNKVIVIAQSTLHELYELGSSGVDAIALYNFYYYTSNWQETRQPKATGKYCWKKLGWSNRRFYKAKQILAQKGLIIEVQKTQKGVFSEVYIKLPYKAKEATTADVIQHLPTADVLDRTAVENTTNTLSVNNIYALNVNNLEEEEDNKNNFNNSHSVDATYVKELKLGPPPSDNTTPEKDVNAIIEFAKDYWIDQGSERITPITKANIQKVLQAGYTVDDFKTAIENSTLWSAGVPRTLSWMSRTVKKFDGFLAFQDRTEQLSQVLNTRSGMRVSVQE